MEHQQAPFRLREYVRWGDVDPARIIRYDAYTRFFELAESEFFRSLGYPYRAIFETLGVGIPRRVMHMDFVSPPVLDEQLEVSVYISQVGTTSMTMNFDFHGDGGRLRATGYLVLVCVDAGEGMHKRPWPPALRSAVAPYCMSSDEARSR
ncbi:MAG: acyl-CoA thioesterase [Gemmatimonadaceae bacterium]